VVFAQENVKTITFYTIYTKPEGEDIRIVNITSLTINGTEAQIKENYPIDEIYTVEESYRPAYHVFEGGNQTLTVYNATKADYMNELDMILSDVKVQGVESMHKSIDI
jgi:hypothetical protein